MEDLKQYANIPAEMRGTPHWLVWRLEDRGGSKPTKTPYSAHGGPGKVNDAKTWDTFGEAILAGQKGNYNGVGFVFTDTPFVAVDIDGCINPDTGEVSPEALNIIDRLQSYTELSQSGEGFHIIVRGKLPEGGRRKGPYEMYGHGAPRYFAMTGNIFGEPRPIRECQAEIDAIHREYIQGERDGSQTAISTDVVGERAEGADADGVDDGVLIARMLRSKNGAEIEALWGGDTSAHGGDDSAADMALCNYLAFYTGKDAQAMDRLFRKSGLMRPKWDERRGRNTYGDITIQKAIADCKNVYDPAAHFKKKGGDDGKRLTELQPEKNDRYQWTDIGNGRLFADWFKDRARYVPERKKWFYYDGRVWRADVGSVRVMEWCKELADALMIYALSLDEGSTKKDFMEHVSRWQSRHRRETILKDAATVHPADWSEFDTNPMLFNCLNGTLNLETRIFLPHDPADMLTKISCVNYDPEARSPRWERFILEIMEGDEDKALYLQKALGYALTGQTQHECFFILYGPSSRNGKGTCMGTIVVLLGDYGRTATPETIAQKHNANSSSPSSDIARLAGARFVNVSEPDKKMVLSSALVKTLTGSDKITARFLHENEIEFWPEFKIFINTNYLPSVTDPTLFSSGRVNVIPFEHHFGEDERDPGLKAELVKPENLSGILNWCLTGLWMLNETGFEVPESVKMATDEYRQHSDKMGRFLADEMEADILAEERTEDVYRRYQQWCARNGHGVENQANFKSMLGNITTVRKKRPPGAGRTVSPQWRVEGYRLRPLSVSEKAGNF